MYGFYKCSSNRYDLVGKYCKKYEAFRKYIYFTNEKIDMINSSHDKQMMPEATNVNNIGAAILRMLTKEVTSIREQYCDCACEKGHTFKFIQ